jgi:hypothetical protein
VGGHLLLLVDEEFEGGTIGCQGLWCEAFKRFWSETPLSAGSNDACETLSRVLVRGGWRSGQRFSTIIGLTVSLSAGLDLKA